MVSCGSPSDRARSDRTAVLSARAVLLPAICRPHYQRSAVSLISNLPYRPDPRSCKLARMAITHAPSGYQCPFCALADGADTDRQQDIVRRTAGALAFISPRWWPRNHGHVLVVPVQHYENLYVLPAEAGHAVHDLVRDIAIAIRRSYGCEGVSTRQHNEPAGNQAVWHHHVHVFPRYAGDELYSSRPYPELVTAEQRQPYAERLRRYFTAE
jgi:histidine triad (HIT) family protein